MVTHGEDFYPMEQKFSAGQSIEDQDPWSDDVYDDGILDFDKNVGELVNELSKLGFRIIVTHVSIRTSDTSSMPHDTPSQAYRTLLYHAYT